MQLTKAPQGAFLLAAENHGRNLLLRRRIVVKYALGPFVENPEMQRTRHFLLIAAAACVLAAGCASNPATGGKNVVVGTMEGEKKTVQKNHQEIVKALGLYDDQATQEYVNIVGQRVARVSDLPNEEFKFFVIDDDAINAFTTGCCNVYVNRGLLVNLNSEAELAGVLGHEIGHITARHPARRQARGVAASLGAMAAAILTGSNAVGQLANIGAQAWMMGYGRENEMEADRLGMKYMVKAGYNPEYIGKVFSMFQAGEKFERERARAEGREPRLYHGVFSSHPSPDERAVQAAKGAANIKDAPPEGWLDPARRIPHDHQRHRLWIEQGAGHRARQPLLSRGHGNHGRIPARLDHREPARPPDCIHAEEGRRHADHDRQETREAGAARIPAHQAQGRVHASRVSRSPRARATKVTQS